MIIELKIDRLFNLFGYDWHECVDEGPLRGLEYTAEENGQASAQLHVAMNF